MSGPGIDGREWDEVCAHAINGTVFHTLGFLAYHPPGRFDWDHSCVRGADGSPQALWPAARSDDGMTWWSGAGASFGGPVLARDATLDSARAAVDGLVREARRRGYRRLVTTPPPPLYERDGAGVAGEALRAAGFSVQRCEVSQAADFSGGSADDCLAGAARRGARKAEREGVTVVEETTSREFHDLLVADRAAIGTEPVHDRGELADLVRRLGSRQQLLTARQEGRVIAGAWSLFANDRVVLSFYLCQDRESRRLRATNLVQREAMRWAAERGAAFFDFGTSSIGGVLNDGLYAFKESHGGKPFDRETLALDLD